MKVSFLMFLRLSLVSAIQIASNRVVFPAPLFSKFLSLLFSPNITTHELFLNSYDESTCENKFSKCILIGFHITLYVFYQFQTILHFSTLNPLIATELKKVLYDRLFI